MFVIFVSAKRLKIFFGGEKESRKQKKIESLIIPRKTKSVLFVKVLPCDSNNKQQSVET